MEKFLQTNPKMKGKIVLLQIAVPSRGEVPGYQKLALAPTLAPTLTLTLNTAPNPEPNPNQVPGYQKLRSNVHKLVSRINGEYGTLEDVPIHYLDQSMKFEELCALYFRAEVMFVTSLRDGNPTPTPTPTPTPIPNPNPNPNPDPNPNPNLTRYEPRLL
jgi:trehalose 6-phosphate synthase/phosphatase